jgi:Zn-dependent protease with chaperone function
MKLILRQLSLGVNRTCGQALREEREERDVWGGSSIGFSGGRLVVTRFIRVAILASLIPVYRVGTAIGAMVLLVLGGFVPVASRWMKDQVHSWSDFVETLGGVSIQNEVKEAGDDLGPLITRYEAPLLFDEVARAARHAGTRLPDQIRLTYLPCCGVVSSGRRRSRLLLLGQPLLHVLTVGELRAVLAHELTHLTRGHAARMTRATRFLEALEEGLGRPSGGQRVLLLRGWSEWTLWLGRWAIEPFSLELEHEADRSAGSYAGIGATARALVTVAMVQPLFREALSHYDLKEMDGLNLYAFFRLFWSRIPESVRESLRRDVLAAPGTPFHPALADRLARLGNERGRSNPDLRPASALLSDPEALEQRLHDGIFGLEWVHPSVFHRAGS